VQHFKENSYLFETFAKGLLGQLSENPALALTFIS